MKKRKFKAPSGETISFTELGFGTAPLGNLFRAVGSASAETESDATWSLLRGTDTRCGAR